MKAQTRPVIVEVKRKRGLQERARSIWGGVDLSRAVAEVEAEAEERHNMPAVDSVTSSTDVVEEQTPEGEQSMANAPEAESTQVDVQTPAAVEAPPKSRAKTPRVKKAKPESPKRAAKVVAESAEPAPVAVRTKRKIYSEKERAQKVAQIKKLISGGASVKSAVTEAKISEQTYYQWVKAAPAVEESDDLKDLVTLEEENKALKKRLAEQLRKENAELKRKLGIE